MRDAPLILVVEDDEHDVELTTRVLMRARVANRIVAIHDGVEAAEWLLREGRHADRPDESVALVLLDLGLPRLSGLELLDRLRADPRTSGLAIVVVTARSEAERRACLDRGANAVLAKPLRLADLAEVSRTLKLGWILVDSTDRGAIP